MTTKKKALTTVEKIKAIEESDLPIAWDGCHKIYFLEDAGRRSQAESFGYEIFPATEVRELISSSCGLVFVSRWGYDNSDFEHDWNIDQCTEDIYEAAKS